MRKNRAFVIITDQQTIKSNSRQFTWRFSLIKSAIKLNTETFSYLLYTSNVSSCHQSNSVFFQPRQTKDFSPLSCQMIRVRDVNLILTIFLSFSQHRSIIFLQTFFFFNFLLLTNLFFSFLAHCLYINFPLNLQFLFCMFTWIRHLDLSQHKKKCIILSILLMKKARFKINDKGKLA